MDLDRRLTVWSNREAVVIFAGFGDRIGQQVLGDHTDVAPTQAARQKVKPARPNRLHVRKPDLVDVGEHVPAVAIVLRRSRTNVYVPMSDRSRGVTSHQWTAFS